MVRLLLLPVPALFSWEGDVMTTDILFNTENIEIGSFVFDERTANVFDDMVSRSVPFYAEMQRMIVELANLFALDNSNIYDIGCSTGTTLINLVKNLDRKDVKLIGVDASEAMLKKARQKADILNSCELINADLNEDFEIRDASVVIMCLTLQFINPSIRNSIISNIFNGLKDKGCLILVEKIVSDDAKLNDGVEKYYHDFKMRNNYSQLEIESKKEALKGVLIPYTYDDNLRLLKRNGFNLVDGFFRWYNFCGIIAVKDKEC